MPNHVDYLHPNTKIWWFIVFVIFFHVFIVCCCISMYCMTYSSTINNKSISVNNSNSTSIYFKHAFHADPGAYKKRAGSSWYIKIHLLRKPSNKSASSNVSLWTYKSWYNQYFLFQSFSILFEHAYNQHLKYFPYLSYCKNFPYQEIMFHQTFSSCPYIRIDKFPFLITK